MGREAPGDRGPAYIAEQIGRLALAGDEAGVATWKKIAVRYSELQADSETIALGSALC